MGLIQVHNAAHNALRNSNGIKGATRMKLDGIIEAVRPKRESFQRAWDKEIEDRVVHIDGDPQMNGDDTYIFKSDEDETEYMAFVGMIHGIEMDPLIRKQLGSLTTGDDEFGSADYHFRALKLVTEGFAEVEINQ